MRNQTIGFELEFTGMSRRRAIDVVADALGSRAYHLGGGYDAYGTKGADGREWKVMNDSSIRAEGVLADSGFRCELVTPILRYADIELLQSIVRALRRDGAKVNSSCGIHVHIGAQNHTARTLKNLTNIVASKERLLFKALGVKSDRQRYCEYADSSFVERINCKSNITMESLRSVWYRGNDEAHMHYSQTRYRALNLHSVFSKGTVEFRMFNATLHAGKIRAYIQLCLAINHQALTQRSASYRVVETDNYKYSFRVWLLRMGLIGDEFKTARLHLLADLDGNSAWRRVAA